MAKQKLHKYSASASVRIWLEVPIRAESFEQAVAIAKDLDFTDYVTVSEDAENLDTGYELYNVSNPSVQLT